LLVAVIVIGIATIIGVVLLRPTSDNPRTCLRIKVSRKQGPDKGSIVDLGESGELPVGRSVRATASLSVTSPPMMCTSIPTATAGPRCSYAVRCSQSQ
jgi:hypothetical protein